MRQGSSKELTRDVWKVKASRDQLSRHHGESAKEGRTREVVRAKEVDHVGEELRLDQLRVQRGDSVDLESSEMTGVSALMGVHKGERSSLLGVNL